MTDHLSMSCHGLDGEARPRVDWSRNKGRTLGELLATWVAHDLGRIAQITRVMAKQYRDAVGPWEAYLPVLHR